MFFLDVLLFTQIFSMKFRKNNNTILQMSDEAVHKLFICNDDQKQARLRQRKKKKSDSIL